jgi:hypothetical protein
VEAYIYPVNLLFRFNPNQDIGTSYGISAKQKLQDPSDKPSFVMGRNFRAVRDRATDALWPYASRGPSRLQMTIFRCVGRV